MAQQQQHQQRNVPSENIQPVLLAALMAQREQREKANV
jgi:hypothetical protein